MKFVVIYIFLCRRKNFKWLQLFHKNSRKEEGRISYNSQKNKGKKGQPYQAVRLLRLSGFIGTICSQRRIIYNFNPFSMTDYNIFIAQAGKIICNINKADG